MTARRVLAAAVVACAVLGASPADAEHGSSSLGLAPSGGQSPTCPEERHAASGERRARAGEPGVRAEEHRGLAGERRTFDVDVDVQLGADGFRLGGRVSGPQGVWGAWLNGTVRRDGFTLDGRLQRPDRATNFRLDADVVERPRRARPGRSL